MDKVESVQENAVYKILSNFEIQADHIIQVGRSDLILIIKKK